jgi:hypothetical protein
LSNPFSKLQTHQLPGNLFGSVINDERIVIESRTDEKLHFSTFNLLSGKLIHEKSSNELTAWHSLVGVEDDHLIIQHFENRKNPDLTTHLLYDQHLDQLIGPVEKLPESRFPSPPSLYTKESPDFVLFQQFINQKIVLACEYQELSDKMIMSYYLQSNNGYTRRLRILADRTIIYDEVQDEDMKGFAPGSFFTLKNRLIFVRHKREINIYEI